jgi:hypothetical protein
VADGHRGAALHGAVQGILTSTYVATPFDLVTCTNPSFSLSKAEVASSSRSNLGTGRALRHSAAPHLGFADKRPGDGDALLLPSGDLCPAVTHLQCSAVQCSAVQCSVPEFGSPVAARL